MAARMSSGVNKFKDCRTSQYKCPSKQPPLHFGSLPAGDRRRWAYIIKKFAPYKLMTEKNNQSISNWIAFIALIVAVGAFIVSIQTCDLSEESIRHAKETFIAANRPYLTVTPVKDKTTNKYLQTLIKKGDIEVKTRYLIRNVGNTPAINISSPIFRLIGETSLAKDAHIETMPVVDLGPREEENIVFTFLLGSKSANKEYAPKLLEAIKAGEAGLLLNIELSYSSNFPNTGIYKYQVEHKIGVDEAKILTKIYK